MGGFAQLMPLEEEEVKDNRVQGEGELLSFLFLAAINCETEFVFFEREI